jgi:hypothetical protein
VPISSAPQAVDASGSVSRVLASYSDAIGAISREVTGDPAAVGRAAEVYRSGATSSNQASTNVGAISSGLAESWIGSASDAYSGAAEKLTTRLAGVEAILGQQAASMRRVSEAQVQVQGQLANLAQGFQADGTNLLTSSRSVPPDAVPALEAKAHRIGAAYHEAAKGLKSSLAQVLAEEAAKLNQAPAATATAPKQQPALTDEKTMYDWIYGCLFEREIGRRGLRESDARTVAGPRASMATPNQTIMSNAITTLGSRPDLWALAHPPLTRDELRAANTRLNTVAQLRELAENRTAAATRAAATAQAAAKKLVDAKAHLDATTVTAANLREQAQQLSQAAAGQPATSAAGRAAKHAADELAKAERQVLAARKQVATDDAAAAAAAPAAVRARDSAADPEKFIDNNATLISATGLDRNDVRNMQLTGLMLRGGSLTADQQAQVAALEHSLGAANRVTMTAADGHRITTEAFATRTKWQGEDLAGWQRKGMNALVVDKNNGSVGERINEIATSDKEHRVLTDAFLKPVLAKARANHPTDEDAVVAAVAKANNSGTVKKVVNHKEVKVPYWSEVLACYNAKKAAAAGKR